MKAKSKTTAKTGKVSAHKRDSIRIAYLASLIENISDALISTDLDFHILEWNAAAESLYGWTEAEVIGHPVQAFIQTEYHSTTSADMIKFVLEAGTWKGEVTQNRKDGSRFPVWAAVSQVRDETGKQIGFVTINRDITERKSAELQVIQMKRLYATLSQVNQTIVRVKDREDLYQSICDVSVNFGEFSVAWVGLLDAASGDVYPTAANGLDVNHWPFPIVNLKTGPRSEGSIARAFHTSQVVTSGDMQTDEHLQSLHDQFHQSGFQSSAVIPFRLRGKTIGTLTLISHEEGLFKDAEELRLLDEMGLDISFALDSIETEAERKRAQEKIERQNQRLKILREIDIAILAADSVENIVGAALSHVRELMDCQRANLTLIDRGTDELVIFDAKTVSETSIPAGSRLPVALFQDIIQTLSQNQPILFSDYRTVVDPMPGIQRLLKDGLLSTCSLPLFSQDSLIGMFSMHSEIPGFFDDEKIALGREVANQVAVALTQNHLVEGLRESEEKYRAFFENSLDAILLTSPDGSIQAANPAACRMFGRTEAEICALSRNELVDTNDPRAAALLEERTKTGKAFGELTMFRNDGSPFPVDMSSALFQDRQGNARTSMIIRDVTERKQTENDLRESEQKFSILFNKAPFAISLSKLPAGVIVEINEEFEKLVGYSRQEAVGQTSLELNLYPDPELRARTKAEFDKHGFARNIETVIQRKTGELRYVLASTDAIEIVGEKLLLSTAQDITERKRAEEQLQYQAHLLENVNDAIVASDAQFTLKAWNSAAERIYGWKAEEVLGRNGVEILQTRFSEADAEEMRRQIAELGHYVGEATQLRRDGTLVPVEVASMVLLDDDGKITGYVSVNREITERKQAEAALGIEVERFKRFVESNIVGIVIANAAGKIITANDYYLNILGVTRQDFEDGNVDWRKFTPPEWLPADEKALRELQERGVCEPYEKEYVRRDGGRVPVYIADAMLPGPEKQIAAFVLDITERKQAEAAVRESGRRIDAIIASAMDAIISIDADQHILLLNAAAEQMFQCRATEVIGQTLERFIPERFHASHRRFIELFDRDGTTNRAMGHLTALTGVRANGEEFPIEASISQVGVTDKKVFTVILRDITERTRAEEQIKSQLQRLNALHSIDIAISSSFDIHVTLDVVLQQVLAQLGVDAAAILLLHPELETLEYAASRGFHSDVLHSPRLKLEEGYAGRAVLDRKTVHVSNGMELGGTLARSLHLKNESFIEYYGTPLIVKGEVEGVLEIYHRSPLDLDPEWQDFLEMLAGQAAIAIDNAQLLHDLQRSNAELEERVAKRTEELNRMNIELEHANRAKDEFLANMSHELRTPLNGILGVSETLLEQRRDPITEYQQRSLQIIQSSGSHLLELINDILDLSKIEARKFDYYPQILSVEELCRSSLIFVKQQAIRKSMTITYREETAGSRVYADPRRLKQILVNLLTNAVKFTPEHGQVTLQVHIDPELDRIQFSVIDNGIGIAPEDLQQLFVPFKQVDSSFTRNHEGTGLGLALVQKLTEMHGGSVDVESEVGNGSRFTVNLPWEQTIVAHEEANQTVGELVPATPSRKSNAAEGERLDRGIILLAEDNLANILTMSDYLETHGYQVVVAHDGAEAIEKAEQIHPHLILMDIQMPVMDGLDATARFRNNPRFASTPIIALTALAMPGDRERCLKAGANEYMSKPVSLKMLMQTIKQLLGQEQ